MKLIFGFIFLENHYIHVFTILCFVQWSVAPNIVCDKFEIFNIRFLRVPLGYAIASH